MHCHLTPSRNDTRLADGCPLLMLFLLLLLLFLRPLLLWMLPLLWRLRRCRWRCWWRRHAVLLRGRPIWRINLQVQNPRARHLWFLRASDQIRPLPFWFHDAFGGATRSNNVWVQDLHIFLMLKRSAS